MPNFNRVKLLNTGAIGSAVAASICCVGPLALALLGLSGGALLLRFEPYRPYLLVGAALMVGAAFWLTYRRPSAESCEPGSACARPSRPRGQEIAMWIAFALLLFAVTFPYLSEVLF